jgi:LytR cell envelope-related transcriptional attenuator
VRGRHLTTAVTMLVLLVILVVAAVLGVRSLFAPVPSDKPSATASPTCVNKVVRKGQRIRAAQVQVSVYNAGTRSGLADETMRSLTKRGFKRGSVGNAPEGSKVKVAQVWSVQRNDAAARLVAHQLGPAIKVFTKRSDLGPGVDVLVGDRFTRLAKAKRVIVAKRASSVCVPRARG